MSEFGVIGIPVLFAVAAMGLVWAMTESLRAGLDAYGGEYTRQTALQYEDLFLFIPADRIVRIARLAALCSFFFLFLLLGDFNPGAGLFRGVLFGALGAGLALFAPRIALAFLRRRRRNRFNLQLVDGLMAMSSALRAGFSILQAFESIVRQGQNPISQEFAMFLQQTRVGVKFEEALRNMETRVGSDDLALMNQAIEIARQTGGNLTEVFDRIAETIRERNRIELRIRSLTAMGRMQAIVVGALPAVLLLGLTLLSPSLTKPLFTSRTGMMLLVLVGLLEAAGALLIRKIVAIKI
ncbi:MAG: type II secretion system F family protein [Kiritimatiellia bacterium]|nr:type II secretion system F family protein [Kiritimatiellia bacterium]